MDTLAFGYILPTTGRIRDFNPLETCAAGRTNEDASRQGLPPNRCNPFVNECISGTFLLCGLSDGEGFCSLSPARQAEFQRLFASPGEFMMLGADHICASSAEFAETAGRLWGGMASGESVVLTKWGGKEAGA